MGADTEETPRDRWARALAMRRAGLTFRAIGDAFGVTGSRAQQLAKSALREENRTFSPPSPPKFWAPAPKIDASTAIRELPLSPRTTNVLLNIGFVRVGELLSWDRDELRREVLSCPNSKRSTWLEIECVLELADPR